MGKLFFRAAVLTLYLMEREGLQTWNGKPLGTDFGNMAMKPESRKDVEGLKRCGGWRLLISACEICVC